VSKLEGVIFDLEKLVDKTRRNAEEVAHDLSDAERKLSEARGLLRDLQREVS
jgi:hypothetical protein